MEHILYYPVTSTPPACEFVIYLGPGASFFLLQQAAIRQPAPTAARLYEMFHWVRAHGRAHAYPFVRTATLRPAPNQSCATDDVIRQWCDAQLDAFTVFLCKREIRSRKRKASSSPRRPRSIDERRL